jgi:hypothetical protein
MENNMNKQEKEIVMNGIHISSVEVEEMLPLLRSSCKRGLRKGKLSINNWMIIRLRQLADDLETYMEKDFTLHDIQDYIE